MKYLFEEPLIEGMIKSRPNRFVMFVKVEGKLERCHCPSTGSIGGIKFSDIPCLLSRGKGERKTKYTVEAIKIEKQWIGINQTGANRYIEFFLKENLLNRMIKVNELRREARLGNSRIDFLVNNEDYLEVKTPLKDLYLKTNPLIDEKSVDFHRLVKHFGDLTKRLKKGSRAIVLLCFIYDAQRFNPPAPKGEESKIIRAAKNASRAGLENWQINLRIDKNGVGLEKLFRLNLHSKS